MSSTCDSAGLMTTWWQGSVPLSRKSPFVGASLTFLGSPAPITRAMECCPLRHYGGRVTWFTTKPCDPWRGEDSLAAELGSQTGSGCRSSDRGFTGWDLG